MATATAMRTENELLQKEIGLLEDIRKSEIEKLKVKEAELLAAQQKLEEAKSSGVADAAKKQLLYKAIRSQRLTRMRELNEGLKAELSHLKSQRQLTRMEAEQLRSERLSLQNIKTRLRDQGLAEFQSYTPSQIDEDYGSPTSSLDDIEDAEEAPSQDNFSPKGDYYE